MKIMAAQWRVSSEGAADLLAVDQVGQPTPGSRFWGGGSTAISIIRKEVPPLESALEQGNWRGGKQPGRWSPGGKEELW